MGGLIGWKMENYSKFCISSDFLNSRGETLAFKKDIKISVNSFMYKGLESNHAKFKQNWAYFEQGGVAAHLRDMRPTPSSDKDILKPNRKLKTLNTTD